jgi:hypothetical protein
MFCEFSTGPNATKTNMNDVKKYLLKLSLAISTFYKIACYLFRNEKAELILKYKSEDENEEFRLHYININFKKQ